MQRLNHPLLSPSLGSHKTLCSLHYGTPGRGPKIYIQASLHAEELPGMLVAHHLRRRLDDLHAQGRVRGEIVLVPAANPIGLQQWMAGNHQGRFDLASGENFNRNYADLTEAVLARPRDGTPGALNLIHKPEPPGPLDILQAEHWEFFIRGEKVAEWDYDPR